MTLNHEQANQLMEYLENAANKLDTPLTIVVGMKNGESLVVSNDAVDDLTIEECEKIYAGMSIAIMFNLLNPQHD